MGCSPWGRKESDTTERLHFHFHALEKEMATHSSGLAWKIPGTGACSLWDLPLAVKMPSPRNLHCEELMLLNCGVGEDSCESLGLQGVPTCPS